MANSIWPGKYVPKRAYELDGPAWSEARKKSIEYRGKHGLTQDAFAELIGLTTRQISYVERYRSGSIAVHKMLEFFKKYDGLSPEQIQAARAKERGNLK